MPYFVEETKSFTTYRIEGFFSYQDLEGLIGHFDNLIKTDPYSKLLIDFSKQTGYEEVTIKRAFHRIEKGFPKTVRIAVVYQGKSGIYKHILSQVSRAMPQIGKFFETREEAIKWFGEES